MKEGLLYLIPVTISEEAPSVGLPMANLVIMRDLRYFIVENARTARRFLKRCCPEKDMREVTMYELNHHTPPEMISSFLEPLRRGDSMGVMSEAGCPGIADPGSVVVSIAQREGLRVKPLTGPSSILLSLMGSGFNGQSFTFSGYLPIDKEQRTKKIKELERRAYQEDCTQIFIETPYRNEAMLRDLCASLRGETLLCIASGLTDSERERIDVRSIWEWRKKGEAPDKKTPAIYLIYHP